MGENFEQKNPAISLKPEDMVGKFHIDEDRKKKALREEAKQQLLVCLSNGFINYQENNLEGVDHVRRDEEESNSYDDYDDREEYREYVPQVWSIPDDVKFSPEVQAAAMKSAVSCLSEGMFDRSLDFIETFNLPIADIIKIPEAIQGIQETLMTASMHERVDYVLHILSKFFNSKDVKIPVLDEMRTDVCKKILVTLLSDGYTDTAIKIKDTFQLPEAVISYPDVAAALKKSICGRLGDKDIRTAEHIINQFSLTPEFMSSPEIQDSVEAIVANTLSREVHTPVQTAKEMSNTFSLSPERQERAAKVGIGARLVKGYYSDAVEIMNGLKIPTETVNASPEIQKSAQKGIVHCLSKDEYGSIENAASIQKMFSFSTDFLSSPELQGVVQKLIVKRLSDSFYDIKKIKEIGDEFHLSEVLATEAAKAGLIKQIGAYRLHLASSIIYTFSLPASVTQSPEIHSAGVKAMIGSLKSGSTDGALNVVKTLSLPAELLLLPEVQQAAVGKMVSSLAKADIDDAIAVKNYFSISAQAASLIEVQDATKIGVAKCFSDKKLYTVPRILAVFPVPEEDMHVIAFDAMKNHLRTGDLDNTNNIQKSFPIPMDMFLSEEMRDDARKGIYARLSVGSSQMAMNIMTRFEIGNDIVLTAECQQSAKKGITASLPAQFFKDAVTIRDVFKVDQKTAQEAATEGLKLFVSRWPTSTAGKQIVDLFSLPREAVAQAATEAVFGFIKSGTFSHVDSIKNTFELSVEDISKASKKAYLTCLGSDGKELAEKIKEKFGVNVSSEDVLVFFPQVQKLLLDLKTITPEFAAQAEKTPDLLITLLEFRNDPDKIISTASENPFLLDAIASNPRFGSRLLLKFPQFDAVSKENIKTQFASKKEIMAKHPAIDPRSVEFRQLMQNSLKGYGVNGEVLKGIDAKGLSSERWLNYDEVAHFNLSSGQNTLAFSEIITTPLERVKETIDAYAHTIKEVLSEYRTELMAFEIALGKGELPTEELQKMTEALEKARQLPAEWKDKGGKTREKIIFGIEKGIENLRAKSTQERKGVLWEKLLADVASFQRLKDDVFKAQEIFIATEAEFDAALIEKAPSGKKIQDLKRRMTSAKDDLRGKFAVMERRIEDFRRNLRTMVAPALGEGRAVALIQDIETRLAEQFNHFDTDKSMLNNLFSQQADKRKEEVESRPMSIFVWTRDPDVDLYQGNYSPCCICIDSQYHGAVSPIADYNADLGIQIVNVWDEVKNEPVTAAWCWLGQDEKGEAALVVDNIESNTFYSSNFSEQFTDELFKYLKNYAKEVGVKKIVLGKANNDLPTTTRLTKFPSDTGKYSKIGGASRAGGYFLEAEDETVKTIWEKGVKPQKEKAEENNEKVDRIVFNEITTNPLTQSDLRPMRALERKVYAENPDLVQGLGLVRDIKESKGFDYSVATFGVPLGTTRQEMIAYAVAVDNETDEGDKSVYLEDIAVAPEAQRQGIGQKLIQELIGRLKSKARNDSKPVLFDMHLRPNSLALFDKQREQFERAGVSLLEDVLVPDYYDEGEDAVYRVYEVAV